MHWRAPPAAAALNFSHRPIVVVKATACSKPCTELEGCGSAYSLLHVPSCRHLPECVVALLSTCSVQVDALHIAVQPGVGGTLGLQHLVG